MLKKKQRSKYKYNSGWYLFNILLFCLLFGSCTQHLPETKVNRAFYYWKSAFRLSPYELKLLDTLQVRSLYVKYFDVDWDNERSVAIPKAILRVQQNTPIKFEIIPCIFITNACILKIDSTGILNLSLKIIKLIEDINIDMDQSHNHEVQIDCDWTAGTKQKFFLLLNTLQKDLKLSPSGSEVQLSCTIRLHQVKYLQRTGVPPVERGMLMVYNMGNLKNPSTKNSILENEELKKYTGNLPAYPLQLDIALPAFNWIVLYRKNEYAGLIQQYNENMLTNPVFKAATANRFEVGTDTTIEGYEFKKGDLLRVEKSEYKEIIYAIESIRKRLPAREIRLSIFHLDSLTLSKYAIYEMETIFSSFD